MTDEPPAKVPRLDDDRRCSAQVEEPVYSSTNPYKGSCRAYGGSDHLPVDDQTDGFQLLDEVNEDDEDNNDGSQSDASEGSSASCSVSQEEIDALLEAGVEATEAGGNKVEGNKSSVLPTPSREKELLDGEYLEIIKYNIVDLDGLHNHFEKLPEGWMQMTHNSGMPVYLHRASRVCTFGRPYFLGHSSVRKHDLPLSAIPCLHYLRTRLHAADTTSKDGCPQPSPTAVPVLDVTAPCSQDASVNTCSASSVAAVVSETSATVAATTPSAAPCAVTVLPASSVSGSSNNKQSEDAEYLDDDLHSSSVATACEDGKVTVMSAQAVADECSGREEALPGCRTKESSEVCTNANVSVQLTNQVNENNSCDRSSGQTIPIRDSKKININTSEAVIFYERNSDVKGVKEKVIQTELCNSGLSDTATEEIVEKTTAQLTNGSDTVSTSSTPPRPFNSALATALRLHPLAPPPPHTLLPPSAKVSLERPELLTIDAEELRLYCQRRFDIQLTKKLVYASWAKKKDARRQQRRKFTPLPEGTKLLSLKVNTAYDESKPYKKRNWVMNPKGKSTICILHEYVQCVLKSQPEYVFKEAENASCPYAAVIYIAGLEYATGYGSSKKIAKSEAARATLKILLPDLAQKLDETSKDEDNDLQFFDQIRIEDPSVPELCDKMSELPPYSLLLNCLQRNYCLNSTNISCHLVTHKKQKNEFIMTVGKHTVQVPCKNKKEGKQKASQVLLQKLHPHINSWGSMVRLYGSRSLQQLRKKKREEQEVTLLQNNATVNQPNFSIINMLRQEMLKLHNNKESVRPLGAFQPPEDVTLPPPSSTDLNTLDL